MFNSNNNKKSSPLLLFSAVFGVTIVAVTFLIFISVVGVDAELLNAYIAAPVDNRPNGRYRFSFFPLSYRQNYWQWYDDHAIVILGGTSSSEPLSSDKHFFDPRTGRWEEDSSNQLTFAPRHSMVTGVVQYSGATWSEIATFGGFEKNEDSGDTEVVAKPLVKSMEPFDPWIEESGTIQWEEPWSGGIDPGARARAGSFTIADKMYIYGGITGDGTIKGDLWSLQTSGQSFTWTSLYTPVETVDSEDFYTYDFSIDEYGGGFYSGYTAYDYGSYGGSYGGGYSEPGGGYSSYYYGSSSYYYGSSSYYGYSSSYYYGSSSSYYGREAEVEEVMKKNNRNNNGNANNNHHHNHNHHLAHKKDPKMVFALQNQQKELVENRGHHYGLVPKLRHRNHHHTYDDVTLKQHLSSQNNNNNKMKDNHAHHAYEGDVLEKAENVYDRHNYDVAVSHRHSRHPHSRQQQKHQHEHQQEQKKEEEGSQQQQQNSQETIGDELRFAEAESASASLLGAADKILRRYGACCSAVSSSEALCFGGTGMTGDYRSVLYFKNTNHKFLDLNISNPNKGPKPVRDAGCTWNPNNKTFIVFGGYDSRKAAASSDVAIYYLDVVTGTWTSTNAQPHFTPVYGHQMCTSNYNNLTYMYGGKSTFATNATLFYLDASNSDKKEHVFKQATPPLVTLPGERAYHIAAATGTSFFVGFGRKAESLTNDFWEYSLLDSTWTKLRTGSLTARWGSSSAILGPSIFIFGGRLETTGLKTTNELLVVDANKKIFSTVDPSDAAPSSRAFHVSFESLSSVIVGLGVDTNGFLLDDWHAFSPITQKWSTLTVVGDAIPALQGAATIQYYNESHSLVGLGYSDVCHYDWYYVRLVGGNKLLSTKLSVNKNGLADRLIKRSFASVAGRGRHILVCGGMASADLASPPDGRCYQVDITPNTTTADLGLSGNTSTPEELGLVGAPAVYLRDSIFTFGGQVIADPTVTDVYYKRMIRVHPNTTCNVTGKSPDDTSCSLCGLGSSGINCEFTAPGYYTTIDGTSHPCPKGTFSGLKGGSVSSVCLPCPFGTFGNETGLSACHACNISLQFCPVGSSSVGERSSALATVLTERLPLSGVIRESNPAAFTTPSLPWFPVGLVAGFSIALALFVALILFFAKKILEDKINYYLPPDVDHTLTKIFVSHSVDGRDMSLAKLIMVFDALDFNISASVLETGFYDMIEDTGYQFLSVNDFKQIFINMIRMSILPPFIGSRAETDGLEMAMGCGAGLFATFSIESVDNFNADHIPAKLGEPRRVRNTTHGGMATIFLILTQVIMVLAILVNFLYSNIQEVKAIVPYPVVQSTFKTNTNVDTNFLITVSVTGPIRNDNLKFPAGSSSLVKARTVCIDNQQQGICNNDTRVTASGVVIPQAGNERLECHFQASTETCHVTWYCANCTVPTEAELLYLFSPLQSANRIDCDVTASTGIRPPLQEWTGELKIAAGDVLTSTVEEATTPASRLLIYSGYPATQFTLGLTPTYFESVELKHIFFPTEKPVLETGYHVRPDAAPSKGKAIAPEFFGTYFDVPVKVKLKADSDMMYVRRTFIQSILDLVSSLLGSLSGVAGVYLALVNFIDERQDTEITLDDVDPLDEEGDDDDGKHHKNEPSVDGNDDENDDDIHKKTKKHRRRRPKKKGFLDSLGLSLPKDEEEEELAASCSVRKMVLLGGLQAEEYKAQHGGDDDDDDDDNNENDNNRPSFAKIEEGQEQPFASGSFGDSSALVPQMSMSSTESDARRCLPLVTLGLSIDTALKYLKIIRKGGILPTANPAFDLEKRQAETSTRPHITLDKVVEREFEPEEKKKKEQPDEIVDEEDRFLNSSFSAGKAKALASHHKKEAAPVPVVEEEKEQEQEMSSVSAAAAPADVGEEKEKEEEEAEKKDDVSLPGQVYRVDSPKNDDNNKEAEKKADGDDN